MRRALFFLLVISSIVCADTFIHKGTKKTFTGYCTNIKKQGKTLVRTSPGFKAKYIKYEDYEIKYNLQGRRNKVVVVYLDGNFSFQTAIDAVKERLDLHANQGPFLVILEIGKIEAGYLANFQPDINQKIQEKQHTEIVALIKHEPNDVNEITESCSKVYYLKDFEKISEAYGKIAADLSLGKFKVTKDLSIAGVQKKYLSAERKIKSSMERINSYLKSIEADQRKLPGLLASYKRARDKVDLANENYFKVRKVKKSHPEYQPYFLRKYGWEIVRMKRAKKQCEDAIKNINSLYKKLVSERKKILFSVKAYSEFEGYGNSIDAAMGRADAAKKEALEVYKSIQ